MFLRQSVLAQVGSIAGALEENEYRAKPMAAGFDRLELEPTRIYCAEDARETLLQQGIDFEAIAPQDRKFVSAFVRAMKPCCRTVLQVSKFAVAESEGARRISCYSTGRPDSLPGAEDSC